MISFTSLAISAILWTATPSPEPSVYPEYNGDVNLVTPGVIGFLATLFIAVATLLIITDMNRRVRRVRYRELAQETIRSEQAAGAIDDATTDPSDDSTTGTATETESTGGTDTDPDVPPTQRAD
ncbi:hypothetical protein [Salinibacterium sp. PAMC 21357]|uniref:hypothetical protein n=1 Tax=Salinibacterium sp. PAMC 21357 TaxID=1112215 RepID=UPI000287D383|nr:hypothetical protein [Salinibacterium sp. PAMC 21357]